MDDIQEAVFSSPKSNKTAVQTLYTEADVSDTLWSKKLSGMSLRQIASHYPGLTFADIQRALKGIFPKSGKKRLSFGLLTGQQTTIIVMTGETIPEGTQVITVMRCECSQWFVSNHPARRKCFVCSPSRKAK